MNENGKERQEIGSEWRKKAFEKMRAPEITRKEPTYENDINEFMEIIIDKNGKNANEIRQLVTTAIEKVVKAKASLLIEN
jgi:hypothetical protein